MRLSKQEVSRREKLVEEWYVKDTTLTYNQVNDRFKSLGEPTMAFSTLGRVRNRTIRRLARKGQLAIAGPQFAVSGHGDDLPLSPGMTNHDVTFLFDERIKKSGLDEFQRAVEVIRGFLLYAEEAKAVHFFKRDDDEEESVRVFISRPNAFAKAAV
jgi:hypothetical protein